MVNHGLFPIFGQSNFRHISHRLEDLHKNGMGHVEAAIAPSLSNLGGRGVRRNLVRGHSRCSYALPAQHERGTDPHEYRCSAQCKCTVDSLGAFNLGLWHSSL